MYVLKNKWKTNGKLRKLLESQNENRVIEFEDVRICGVFKETIFWHSKGERYCLDITNSRRFLGNSATTFAVQISNFYLSTHRIHKIEKFHPKNFNLDFDSSKTKMWIHWKMS